MKKLIVIPFVALTFILCFSMKVSDTTEFSLPELEKLCNYSFSDFETFVLKKGYSYKSDFKLPNSKTFFSDNTKKDGTRNIITRIKGSNTKTIITFSTSSKEYYLSFKASLQQNGYKFNNEETTTVEKEEITSYSYSNGIYSVRYHSSETNQITTYTILIVEI